MEYVCVLLQVVKEKAPPRYSHISSYFLKEKEWQCAFLEQQKTSSTCIQEEMEPGKGAGVAMFSLRFNPPNQEACHEASIIGVLSYHLLLIPLKLVRGVTFASDEKRFG